MAVVIEHPHRKSTGASRNRASDAPHAQDTECRVVNVLSIPRIVELPTFPISCEEGDGTVFVSEAIRQRFWGKRGVLVMKVDHARRGKPFDDFGKNPAGNQDLLFHRCHSLSR